MHYFTNLKNSAKRSLAKYFKRINSLRNRDLYVFLLSILIIIAIKFIQFPSLTHNAEMFAENGTNFFLHAYKDNLLTNLLTTDAGYLPLTQRIIAVTLVKGFHAVALYPFLSQLIAVFIIAVMSSLINFNIFKNFHQSALIRFILGISIGLISDYELNAFINFIYYGAIFLFLGIFINKKKLNKSIFFLFTLTTVIILLSKGQFIVFIPIYLILALLYFRKKDYRSLTYYLFAIAAGLTQLIVMYINIPQAASTNRLLHLPYYVIKTVYYFFLTYKHVFFGYIAKEGTTFISMGILLLLLVVGIKTLLSKKDWQTLSIFLAGNFIALCSLFLTVVALSNSAHIQTKAATAPSASKTVLTTPQKITQAVIDDSRREKNVLEVKHFANLRSMFISNLLIFLTGIIVILYIFPRKSQKILVLLILLYSSGAFGQIRVEEAYANKNQSYSQWNHYYHLLNNNQFCIPVNHYPFLLQQNCDYLLYKNQDLPLLNSPVQFIELSKITPTAKNWEIQAVALINKPLQFSATSFFELYAYDKKDEIIGRAKQLVPGNYEYIYYLFDKPVLSADKLIWRTREGKEIKIIPNILIFGTDKKVSHRRFEY